MDIRMSKSRLQMVIRDSSKKGVEARQVCKRLLQLLPIRFQSLRTQFRVKYKKVSTCDRHVLISEDYIEHLNELNQVRFQAVKSKIEYETHLMLFQARQSIQKAKRLQLFQTK